MNENNALWVNLTTRVVRVALMRKNVGYAELARRLATFGVTDDNKALAARMATVQLPLAVRLRIQALTRHTPFSRAKRSLNFCPPPPGQMGGVFCRCR